MQRQCVYSLFVRTGDRAQAGTDAKINITLADTRGESFVIHNLEKWGLMNIGHKYLESGNTDFFSVKGKCLTPPVCKMILSSDGSGYSPSWFVDYIKVTQTETHVTCAESIFSIQKWLGTDLHHGVSHAPFEMVVTLVECIKRSTHHQISWERRYKYMFATFGFECKKKWNNGASYIYIYI